MSEANDKGSVSLSVMAGTGEKRVSYLLALNVLFEKREVQIARFNAADFRGQAEPK
jgi:hypothetical protein